MPRTLALTLTRICIPLPMPWIQILTMTVNLTSSRFLAHPWTMFRLNPMSFHHHSWTVYSTLYPTPWLWKTFGSNIVYWGMARICTHSNNTSKQHPIPFLRYVPNNLHPTTVYKLFVYWLILFYLPVSRGTDWDHQRRCLWRLLFPHLEISSNFLWRRTCLSLAHAT